MDHLALQKTGRVIRVLNTEPQAVTLAIDAFTPSCPWCDEVLDGVVINGLHEACNEAYMAEMAEVWGDDHEAQEIEDELASYYEEDRDPDGGGLPRVWC